MEKVYPSIGIVPFTKDTLYFLSYPVSAFVCFPAYMDTLKPVVSLAFDTIGLLSKNICMQKKISILYSKKMITLVTIYVTSTPMAVL